MPDITKTFKAVHRAMKAAASAVNPGEFEAAGTPVQCAQCRGREFNESPNLGGGVNLVCRKCHLTLWFAQRPKALRNRFEKGIGNWRRCCSHSLDYP